MLATIGGMVVTFQLTPEGERKLASAGIAPGALFPRALLLDLYRSGHAFTRGTGAEKPAPYAPEQLALDFSDDPDPETAFPACDLCAGVNDLHLTLAGSGEDLTAQLRCPTCRASPDFRPEVSIPIELVSRSLLSRLFQIMPARHKAGKVEKFAELLQAEFESRWAATTAARSHIQTRLPGGIASAELNLET